MMFGTYIHIEVLVEKSKMLFSVSYFLNQIIGLVEALLTQFLEFTNQVRSIRPTLYSLGIARVELFGFGLKGNDRVE